MSKTLPPALLLLLLTILFLVSGTDDPVNTYLFKNGPLTICPLVSPSPATPSFRLQPSSAAIGFLNGTYTYSGNKLANFKFSVETRRCEPSSNVISNDNCSVLNVISLPTSDPLGQGSLEITFTSTAGDTQITTVNYGSVGMYVSPNRILRRQLNSASDLDGSVIAYGQIPPPAVLCTNGTGQRLSANLIPTNRVVGSCSRIVAREGATFVDPVLFRIVIDPTIVGRHVVYAAARNNCLDSIRSLPFEILLDPVTPPEVTTEMTFATPATTPTGKGLSDTQISIIAVVIGVFLVVVVFAIIAFVCYRSRRKKKGGGVGSRTSSMSSADPDGGRPSPIINLLQGHRNDLTRVPSRQKKLFIVKSDGSDPIKRIAESLHELNSDLQYSDVPAKNGRLPEFVAKIVKDEDRVIILGDGGELHQENASQPDKLSPSIKWVQELQRPAGYTRKELRNVFLVLFGNEQDLDSLQRVSNLPRIPVSHRLDSSNLDTASIAKIIQDQVEILLSKNEPSQSEGDSTPNLTTRSENSSTDSKRKANVVATPPTHDRLNHLKGQPGTESGSDISATNSLTQLLQTVQKDMQTVQKDMQTVQKDMQTGFKDIRNAFQEDGQATRNALQEDGQATRNTIMRGEKEVQENFHVLNDGLDQVQIALQNQNLHVTQPYPDDPTHTQEQQPHTPDHGASVNYDNQEPNEGPTAM